MVGNVADDVMTPGLLAVGGLAGVPIVVDDGIDEAMLPAGVAPATTPAAAAAATAEAAAAAAAAAAATEDDDDPIPTPAPPAPPAPPTPPTPLLYVIIGNDLERNLLTNFGAFVVGKELPLAFTFADGRATTPVLCVNEFFLIFFLFEFGSSCNLDLFGSGLFEKNTFRNCSSRKTCS